MMSVDTERKVVTAIALFDSFEEGYAAVEDLVSNGFSRGDISFVASDPRRDRGTKPDDNTGFEAVGGTLSGAADGAAVGGSLSRCVDQTS